MFKDRIDAGKQLAKAIGKNQLEKSGKNTVILALPRGGVVVGAEIARELNLPLDIVITRKIGYPDHEEYAIGAVGKHSIILSEQAETINKEYIDNETEKQREEINRRLKLYKGDKPHLNLKNKTAILVDDGIATGLTMLAAIKEVKIHRPKKIILAIPVGAPDTIENIKSMVDEIICLKMPADFIAVGQFYENFPQTNDQEVIKLLEEIS